ncbi:MAG: hypothetical protein ACOC4G_07625 [Bacillota bacterium]
MNINYILGILIIVLSYIGMWGLILKSKNIVEKISENKLKSLREIERKLKL